MPLSVEIVTTVPAGDRSVRSRSPGKVWRRNVVRRTFAISGPAFATTKLEVDTAGESKSAVGVPFVNVRVVVGGAAGRAVSSRPQLVSSPLNPEVSSEIRSVQTPFGSSPWNAPSASSTTAGVRTTLFEKIVSVTTPVLMVCGT